MNDDIAETYKEWLGVAQGHPDAAALLTLTQCLVEIVRGNSLAYELADGIKAGLSGSDGTTPNVEDWQPSL